MCYNFAALARRSFSEGGSNNTGKIKNLGERVRERTVYRAVRRPEDLNFIHYQN